MFGAKSEAHQAFIVLVFGCCLGKIGQLPPNDLLEGRDVRYHTLGLKVVYSIQSVTHPVDILRERK